MAYRTILVELAGDSALQPRLQVARGLADRFDAVLIGMHVMPPPFIPASYGDATAYIGPEFLEAQRKANREIAERVQAVFRSVCGEGASAVWQEAEGDRGQLLAEAARTVDLVLARRAEPEGTDVQDVLDDLVSAAGVPVLALPSGFAGRPRPDRRGRLERVARGRARRSRCAALPACRQTTDSMRGRRRARHEP